LDVGFAVGCTVGTGVGVSLGTDVGGTLEDDCMAGLLAATTIHRTIAANNTVATMKFLLRLRLRYC
jgi:hypothetical protein